MNRQQIEWDWSDVDSQGAFAEWVGFPDGVVTERETMAALTLPGVVVSGHVLEIEFRLGSGRDLADNARFHLTVAFNHALGFMEEKVGAHFSAVFHALLTGGSFLLTFAGPLRTWNWPPPEEKSWAKAESATFSRTKLTRTLNESNAI